MMSYIHPAKWSCLSGVSVAVVLVLMLSPLATGCMRFVYNATPTVLPHDIWPPTSEAVGGMRTPTFVRPTLLRTDPSVVELAVGAASLVQIWVDSAERLGSVELRLSFDPRYVYVEDAEPDTPGKQIGVGMFPAAAQVQQNEVNDDAGLIMYHVTTANPTSGSGMVASFTVEAVAEGGSPLRFELARLLDAEGQPLPGVEQADGMVIIGVGQAALPPTQTLLPATPASAAPTALPTPSPAPTAVAQTGGIYYTVQPWENLYRIALRYGTTVDAIVAANHLPSRNLVQAGQVLLIPVHPPSGTVAYIVQPGDTLFSIARRFSTTVEALAALNDLTSPNTIRAGQLLIITP